MAAALPAKPAFTVRRIEPAEVDPLYSILVDAGRHMNDVHGLDHWYPPYPIDVMRQHARDFHVFGVFPADAADAAPVATFTVGLTNWTSYFKDDMWAPGSARPCYLGKLAVRPDYQGKALGRWCMAEVERWARGEGADCIRFDAVTAHPFLKKFYTSCGYEVRCDVTCISLKGTPLTLTCYEMLLPPPPAVADGGSA